MTHAQENSNSIKVLQPFWPTKQHADPTGTVYVGDWVIFQNLYSTLVELSSSKTVRPALAERWTQSADGKRWVFYLRKNLRWSDGSPLTTEQVVKSLQRTAKGTAHTSFSSYIESIRSTSDTEIEMKLKQTPRNFLILLAFVDSSIIHPKAYENNKFNWDVPQSGPFQIVSYSNTEMKLAANPHYWDYASDKVHQATLVKVSSGDPQERINLLLNSSWDASPIDAGIIQNFVQVDELKKKYDVFIGNPEFLFCINFSKKRTKNKVLTPAFRQYLFKEIYSRFWKNDRNNTFRASGFRFHTLKGALSIAQFDAIFSQMKSISTKQEKPPKSLEVLAKKRTKEKPIAIHFLQILRDLGISIKEIILDGEEFDKKYTSGDFDLELSFSGATEDDPDTAWRYYNNDFAEPVATVEELNKAHLETNRTKRNQMYQEFEKRAVEKSLFIPLKYEPTYIVTSKRVILDPLLAADWGLQLFKLRMR